MRKITVTYDRRDAVFDFEEITERGGRETGFTGFEGAAEILRRFLYSNRDVNTDVTSTCAERGHSRALTPRDIVWRICDRCEGEGTLGGYPGVYTAEDMWELGDDFVDDYMEHRRPCEDCGGSGKVKVLSDEALGRPVVQEWLREYWDTEATYRAERRMGA